MDPPPPTPWADGLSIDLLLLIVAELCCLADRASFASVCHRWREAAKLANAKRVPNQIPWLLLPSPAPTPSIFSFLSGARRRIRSFPADFRRERLCGSHPGGWVTVTLGPFGRHLLANIYSRARFNLPHRLKRLPISTVTPVLIRAVILSAAPTAANCIAGAMVCGASNIAFCRPGVDSHWYAHPEIRGGSRIWTMVVEADAEADASRKTFIQNRSAYLMPERTPDTMLPTLPKSTSRTGYLVVSRKKLLLVTRYYSRDSQSGVRRTLMFRVFEMQVEVSADRLQNHKASWEELEDLDDRVLFVARGCSRAFEASELHGFDGGSIYYLDDAEFDVMPLLQNEAEYRCSDMGMYSMPGTTVRPSLKDARTANKRPSIYGAETYLAWFCRADNANEEAAKQSVVEMTEDEGQRRSGGQIVGSRWSILSEPQTKFSPPIWFYP
uniref:KIB1-4 beta-propeller domain-containing protein n=1 Tax=Setaria italica TaxID=4555 RepID=K3XPN1_SETIT